MSIDYASHPGRWLGVLSLGERSAFVLCERRPLQCPDRWRHPLVVHEIFTSDEPFPVVHFAALSLSGTEERDEDHALLLDATAVGAALFQRTALCGGIRVRVESAATSSGADLLTGEMLCPLRELLSIGRHELRSQRFSIRRAIPGASALLAELDRTVRAEAPPMPANLIRVCLLAIWWAERTGRSPVATKRAATLTPAEQAAAWTRMAWERKRRARDDAKLEARQESPDLTSEVFPPHS